MSSSPPHLPIPPNTPNVHVSETSQTFIDQSYTDFHVSPNSPGLLTLDELFAPSTNDSPCNLTAQLYPSRPLPLKRGRVGEDALVNGNVIPEQAIAKGSFSLGTKRVRFNSPLPSAAHRNVDDGTSIPSEAPNKDLPSQTTTHVRLLSPLLFEYRSPSPESTIYNGDDNGSLMNLVSPLSTQVKSSPTIKRSRFVSPPPMLINSHSTSSVSSEDDGNLVGPVSKTTSAFSSKKMDKSKRRPEKAKKRNLFKKNQKKRLVGKRSSSLASRGGVQSTTRKMRKLSKRKGKQHHGRVSKSRKSLKNKKKTQSSFIADDDDVASASEGLTRTGHDLDRILLIKDTFLAKVKKSWDEVVTAHLDNKSNRLEPGRVNTENHNNFVLSLSRPDSRATVRNHLRNLMFLNTSERVPWSTLGIWLWLNKKRFTNWDKSIPFSEISPRFLINSVSSHHKKLLVVNLVDWTADEIKFENAKVPLVIDRTGRVLVNVGDLLHLYPDHVDKFSATNHEQFVPSNDEESSIQESQSEAHSSQSSASSASSSSSSSSGSSSVDPPRAKRKRRTRFFKQPQRFVVADSDVGSDSSSGSEEGDSDSDYETEEESVIDTKGASKGKMKKDYHRVY